LIGCVSARCSGTVEKLSGSEPKLTRLARLRFAPCPAPISTGLFLRRTSNSGHQRGDAAANPLPVSGEIGRVFAAAQVAWREP
jgi:hypothetical protein